MATRKKTTHQAKLHELADNAVEYADALLFYGSMFGGRSLQELLESYKENGPYHPVRGELISHLHRCIDQLVETDAFIRARASCTPDK
jgi:hypothetical protein